MNKGDIEKYNYCKNHLQKIDTFKKDVKHNFQMYGCGRNQPQIEHSLDRIHREMHEKIMKVYDDAKKTIEGIIEKI